MKSTLILAIESSSRLASVALLEDDRVLGELSSDNPKTHSEFLNAAIEKLLQDAGRKIRELSLIAVGNGPGSFTGIRVAVNIARAFGCLLQIPVFAVDSLSILQFQSGPDCICMTNAFKNNVYLAVFRGGHALLKPCAVPLSQLEATLLALGLSEPTLCVGDAFDHYQSFLSPRLKSVLGRNTSHQDFPLATTLGKIACKKNHFSQQSQSPTLDWKSVIPLYLRGSEAEENLQHR